MHKLLKECPECGHGTIADDFGEEITCPTCSGSGKVPAEISAEKIIKYNQDNQSELFYSEEYFSKFAEDYLKGIDRKRKDSLEWGEDRYREGLEKAKQLFLERVEVKDDK